MNVLITFLKAGSSSWLLYFMENSFDVAEGDGDGDALNETNFSNLLSRFV